MAVFPKCKHLNLTMKTSSLLGIFPSQFLFKDNTFLQKAYTKYSNLIMLYYLLFLITAYIKLCLIILNSEAFQLDLVSINMTVTLINTITFIKQLVMRLTPSFKDLVKQIIDNEKDMDSMDDIEINHINEKFIKLTIIGSNLYLSGLLAVIIQYYVIPVINGPTQQIVGNDTIIVKPLPLSLWSPFDDQKYYFLAYLRHVIDGALAISFIGYTDIFMFTLIAFPVGQLQILNYILENFETYKQKYKSLHNITNDNDASYFVFVENIIRHKNIILYVNRFNATMSVLMVLEFFHFSVEIAVMCIQAVATNFSPAIISFSFTGFLSLLIRLFLYYYYANEVIVLSQNLAFSIYKSNWYDQSSKIKFMMLTFIARVQKPLSYTIGPFGYMSLDTMIAILKGSYTYLMLMYNTK